MKTELKLKKLLIALTLFTVSSLSCFSQTFNVTDVKSRYINEDNLQKKKTLMLGAKVEMSFYDSSVKIKVITVDNQTSTIVLDKSTNKDSDYSSKIDNAFYTLTLHKQSGVVYAATLTSSKIVVQVETFIYTLKKTY